MATINQSKVQSGFDVEALLGERYLQMLLQTAFDAGLIPSEAVLGETRVMLAMLPDNERLYESGLNPQGEPYPQSSDAFETEILSGHPSGAHLRARLRLGTDLIPPIEFDLFLLMELVKEVGPEGISAVGIAVDVADVESPALAFLASEYELTKDDILGYLRQFVNRTIDIGGASKFKRIEDLAIRWHAADDDHPAALGLYINLFIRNGDEDDAFLVHDSDLARAENFLPEGEDIAMATRPGLYADMARDVFCRTAVPLESGGFDHAFRKSLLNPRSTRLGDMHSVHVGQIPPIMSGQVAIPQNGLRITVKGDLRDPIELTTTDLTYIVDIRPGIAADGTLTWDTDFTADVDAVFEFITMWAAALLGIAFGPGAALIFLGAVFVVDIGVGIGISLYKEGSISSKADATLSDVVPDRLTVMTRRWDPFYATLHQVVIKPTQAQFNAAGFMLCGKAFVGRQLVPPVNTYIRDETRDESGAINGLRYFIGDYETVNVDSQIVAPGASRRSFVPADVAEPDLWTLSLDAFEQRRTDPEGPLVLTNIPYFPASVYIKDHQIDGLLCISGAEIEQIQDEIRESIKEQGRAGINARERPAITEEVREELSQGGVTPTEEEITAEVDRRIEARLKRAMDQYRSPEPLAMAFSGSLQPHLRFDVAPEELIMLQKKHVLAIDGAVRTVKGRRVVTHLRDRADPEPGPEGDEDNLLNRPRYKPSATGPIFR